MLSFYKTKKILVFKKLKYVHFTLYTFTLTANSAKIILNIEYLKKKILYLGYMISLNI
jgi:hypothetical protein